MNLDFRKTWLDTIHEQGIAGIGLTTPHAPLTYSAYLDSISRGLPPNLEYLARNAQCRIEPDSILPGTQSVICCALMLPVFDTDLARKYARFCAIGDYHQVMRQRLSALDQVLKSYDLIHTSRICVDSAPVLERELAVRAGLGSIGFNRMVIHQKWGSFIALGELFVDTELAPLRPEIEYNTESIDDEQARVTPGKLRCCSPGNRRCVLACPVAALSDSGYDMSRCLSYWSTQHKGEIPVEFAMAMGSMLWGCDRCQLACPRNAGVPRACSAAPNNPLNALTLTEILTLSARQLKKRLEGSPIADAHPYMLQRNACIVIGNTDQREFAHILKDIAANHPCDWVRNTAARVCTQWSNSTEPTT